MKGPKNIGFTLVELLVCFVIVATLGLVVLQQVKGAKMRANQTVSTLNLRSMVIANWGYVADFGTYCPANEPKNRVRWHGARTSAKEKFDPTKGFLSDYLGKDDRVGICPEFKDHMDGNQSFENGSGGYGYNAIYIGGTPANPFLPNRPSNVDNPARTLMFATTALAKSKGVQEYPFAEPRRSVTPDGKLAGALQPSVHFRFGKKALIAWCDGHVSAEGMDDSSGENFYGGKNKDAGIGFCGPEEENGWWNPKRN
ncbi:MAG: type II secretion system protein [Armatimonadetes bacterium]|nr:type II secretion system protein [Akkermansiaceae bacterium]